MKTKLVEGSWALERLRRDPIRHAWGIQDLTRWPDRSQLHVVEDDSPLGMSYLLVSGHPASRSCSTVILGGEPDAVGLLLREHLPKPPVVIRETPDTLREVIAEHLPSAPVFLQQRMEVAASSFRPEPSEHCRRLTTADAPALAAFHRAPPQAAEGMKHWIRGAFVMGAFDGDELLAIGSTMVQLPEVWLLVSIETRSDRRGEGLGTRLTSALTEAGLQNAGTVSLTVRKDNPAAVRVYEKLGYAAREDRVWFDHGAGSSP